MTKVCGVCGELVGSGEDIYSFLTFNEDYVIHFAGEMQLASVLVAILGWFGARDVLVEFDCQASLCRRPRCTWEAASPRQAQGLTCNTHAMNAAGLSISSSGRMYVPVHVKQLTSWHVPILLHRRRSRRCTHKVLVRVHQMSLIPNPGSDEGVLADPNYPFLNIALPDSSDLVGDRGCDGS